MGELMYTKTILVFTTFLLFVTGNSSSHSEVYHLTKDSAVAIQPSQKRIAVQADSTVTQIVSGTMFDRHPCLDPAVSPEDLGRGFWIYGISNGYGYDNSHADLMNDSAVNRAIPVYLSTSDSAEYRATDLVAIRFDPSLTSSSMASLLASNGLRFVDSAAFAHGWVLCALDDTIKTDPFSIGNRMCLLPEVVMAGAEIYSKAQLLSEPLDPYYTHQYWLKDRDYPYRDVDIDADSAWLVPLIDSNLKVAVIDEGIAEHEDLPWSRLEPGFDAAGPYPPPQPDWDPTPGYYSGHGLACAGILAASTNDTGVVGVCPSCRVIPIKIYYDDGDMTTGFYVGLAISYAASHGAKIISNSWGYQGPPLDPLPWEVVQAINEVTTPNGSARPYSCTVFFAAGNERSKSYNVYPSAALPNVIAVGALKRDNTRWDWSCWGPELDVVAPTGDVDACGDMWTDDQMGSAGFNPDIRRPCFPYEPQDRNYTSTFGGTSAACPQAAGIAALVLSRRRDFYTTPGLRDTCNQIVCNVLTRSAEDVAAAGFDDFTGYGRVNAYRALLSVIHGDFDNDGDYDVFDVNAIIDFSFSGGPAPVLAACVADVNCDGAADVFDVVNIIDIAFSNGQLPLPCYECY